MATRINKEAMGQEQWDALVKDIVEVGEIEIGELQQEGDTHPTSCAELVNEYLAEARHQGDLAEFGITVDDYTHDEAWKLTLDVFLNYGSYLDLPLGRIEEVIASADLHDD